MNYKDAKEKLSELRDSLNEVLGNNPELTKEDAEQALKTARAGAKQAKKTFINRVKDFPVVDKITQLGAAGTVAVGTAAVTQTNIAVDETELFVASVANDVVEQRFYVPPFLDRIVDFPSLDSWGQKVMKAKVEKVKAEAAKVEAKVATIESQTAQESESQEPQAQEESASGSDENQESAKGSEQVTSAVESEEVENSEVENSEESSSAEPVPEENSPESVEEIDEVKPHSDIESDESGKIIDMKDPVITPDDGLVVSPSVAKPI